jgi:hypothetical protein
MKSPKEAKLKRIIAKLLIVFPTRLFQNWPHFVPMVRAFTNLGAVEFYFSNALTDVVN